MNPGMANAAVSVLAAPRRREILRLVWDEERPAGAIHAAMPEVTFGAVSQHLRTLERAGLVACRRHGRLRLYSAQQPAVGPLRAWLEHTWSDALSRLQVAAELEQARRGPRSRGVRARRRAGRSRRQT